MKAHGVKPEIEAFDLSHIHHAALMQADGRLEAPAYIQFVMGVKNAMPADRDVFDYYIRTMERLLPGSEWCGAGIGRYQLELNECCVAAGGHAGTGFVYYILIYKLTIAPSNAALVRRVVEICEAHERPVATPAEARALLGLNAVAPVAAL